MLSRESWRSSATIAKGGSCVEFFGKVESDAFIVTKRKKDWLSKITGAVVLEITLKESGASFSNEAMRNDFYEAFRVADILERKLIRRIRYQGGIHGIEGKCAEEYQDLADIIASLLLHYNEDMS